MKYNSKKASILASKDLDFEIEDFIGKPLEFYAREGARMLLEAAFQHEIIDILERMPYERKTDEGAEGYRNGKRMRKVICGSGEITIAKPKIVGAKKGFRSQVLKRWQKKSDELMEVLPMLYVEGLSTRDFKRALKPLWGGSGFSRSSISRANKALKQSFAEWRKRDLSNEDIVYLFLDGYYCGVRMGTKDKEALLIAHGITRVGKRILLAVHLGGVESTDSWKGVINDLKERGLKQPQLVISDGNKGLQRALKNIWPDVPYQRCTVHKTRNVLDRVPKKNRAEVKHALHKIFHAACLEDALHAAKEFDHTFAKQFPTATEVLANGLEECLTFYQYPESHWRRIRTSNVIERAFREIRRRTDVIGRFPNELSVLALVFGVLEQDRLKWRGIKINDDDYKNIHNAVLRFHDQPIVIKWTHLLEVA